jgi:hypothetical protein
MVIFCSNNSKLVSGVYIIVHNDDAVLKLCVLEYVLTYSDLVLFFFFLKTTEIVERVNWTVNKVPVYSEHNSWLKGGSA